MLKFLNQEFSHLFSKFQSHGSIRDDHIQNFLSDLRNILLSADTNLGVVENLIPSISEQIKSQKLIKSVSPTEMMTKIIYEEMVKILSVGNNDFKVNLPNQNLNNLLILGLQGSGKTTASAKLALKFKQDGFQVLLVSLDIYRPAAQKQLEILAESKNIDSLPIVPQETPMEIAHRAQEFARQNKYEIIIYDTAGRMQIDHEMMEESLLLKKFLKPVETILVIDSMIGQESVNIATKFDEKLTIDSFTLSRTDGDSKGGAALSIKYVTKKPIKFLSSGEHLEDLEIFDPKSIVSRILNMGNLEELANKIKTLTNESDQNFHKSKLAKIQSGNFNFDDYLIEIQNINKIGGFSKLLSMLPGLGQLKKIRDNPNIAPTENLEIYKSIILSMTLKERRHPYILNLSRKKRIALGAGVSISKVEQLIKKFNKMKILMKKMSKFASNA